MMKERSMDDGWWIIIGRQASKKFLLSVVCGTNQIYNIEKGIKGGR
jgi:hypothetical protein